MHSPLTRATDFYVARSRDGINFTVETEPVNYPMRPLEAAHEGHRFDMRVTKTRERGHPARYVACGADAFRNFNRE